MKSKPEQPKPLPGEYVKCPNSLLERRDVGAVERNLWLVMEARCVNKDWCNPSVANLCSFVGINDSWCRQVIKEMERKGILRTEHENGKCKKYYPLEPRHSTGAVESNPVSVPAGGRHSTGAVTPKPRHSTDDETDNIQMKETNGVQPSVDASPPASQEIDSKSGKKPKKPTEPRVKQLIDYYCTAHHQKRGAKYIVSKGKDGQHFKDLLAESLSLETLQACIGLFLVDTDPWLNGKPRSIGMFRSRINNYLPQVNQATNVPVPASQRRLP